MKFVLSIRARRTHHAVRALRTLRALRALRTLRTLRALHALRTLRTVRALRAESKRDCPMRQSLFISSLVGAVERKRYSRK